MRNRALLTACLALLAFAAVTTAASATTIKLVTGGTVPSGASIAAALKTGTTSVFNGGSAGNITCNSSSFGGSLGTNPATPSVIGSLTWWTFSGCTDTVPFVTVSSVSMGTGPKTVTATYLGAASTFTVSSTDWTVTFTDGRTCSYSSTTNPATAQHNSLTSPWNNEYAFTAVPLTKSASSTSLVCPSSNVTWSATYVLTSGGTGITIQP